MTMPNEFDVIFPRRRRMYLMRHGEVEYFDAAGKPLPPDTVPLNANGMNQAEVARKVLLEVPLDHAICSDLPRCLQTAHAVLKGRGIIPITDGRLREIKPGRLANIPPNRIKEVFLGSFSDNITRESRFLEGESFGELEDRVLPALSEVLANPAWKNLLIVAHGGVNRVILAHALGIALSCIGRLEQDPACLNLIEWDEAHRPIVRLMNSTLYDSPKLSLQGTTMEMLLADLIRRRQKGSSPDSR